MLHDLLTFFSKTYADVFNITLGPPLHDPLAVASILPTNEISWVVDKVQVHVVCDDTSQAGRTIKRPVGENVENVRGDGLGKGGKLAECVVNIPKSVDVDAFWKVVLKSVKEADGRYSWADEAAQGAE
jgi:uridine nucleosidase